MGNMSYCKFVNTYDDLMDCYEHMDDKDLSDAEQIYREKLIGLCTDISDDYDIYYQD